MEAWQTKTVETHHKCCQHHKKADKPCKSVNFNAEMREKSTLMAMQWGSTLDSLRNNSKLKKMIQANHQDGTVESMHPAILSAKAKANQADNPTWKEAMNGSEAKAHWEACRKEIDALKAKDILTDPCVSTKFDSVHVQISKLKELIISRLLHPW